jgi:hypothetical protein
MTIVIPISKITIPISRLIHWSIRPLAGLVLWTVFGYGYGWFICGLWSINNFNNIEVTLVGMVAIPVVIGIVIVGAIICDKIANQKIIKFE